MERTALMFGMLLTLLHRRVRNPLTCRNVLFLAPACIAVDKRFRFHAHARLVILLAFIPAIKLGCSSRDARAFGKSKEENGPIRKCSRGPRTRVKHFGCPKPEGRVPKCTEDDRERRKESSSGALLGRRLSSGKQERRQLQCMRSSSIRSEKPDYRHAG
jgi:hypothetical protein